MAPSYDYDRGTATEENKKGKNRYEVAFGHPFMGVEYPFGALVYYRRKAEVTWGGPRAYRGTSQDGNSTLGSDTEGS